MIHGQTLEALGMEVLTGNTRGGAMVERGALLMTSFSSCRLIGLAIVSVIPTVRSLVRQSLENTYKNKAQPKQTSNGHQC